MLARSADLLPEIGKLVESGMNPKLHWFLGSESLIQLASTMVGMANCEGGTILLGISPGAGELVGIDEPQSALEKIYQAALLIEPTLVIPMPRVVDVEKMKEQTGVKIIILEVPPGLPYVYSFQGKYYGRDGAHSSPLPTQQLYRLLSERGSVQFESRIVPDASLDDLDHDEILSYAESIGKIDHGDFHKACEFLIRRGCLKKVDDILQVTNAAILLFGYSPQQWLPNATILASRFPGSFMSDTYVQMDITGSLPSQLRQAEDFLRTNLKTVVRLSGLTHQERLEYPFEAVRELIVNAVAHRDYNLQGDNIHLNIFTDHLVVSSPGKLPGPMTLENLLIARFARNAVIAQVLSDLGYVERLGYGIDRVVSAIQKEGLPPPRFEEVGGTFQVTLIGGIPFEEPKIKTTDLSRYLSMDLNPRQEIILAQLTIRQRITNHDYQALCPGVNAETLRRDLADLVNRGVLIKIGDKKATYYILKRI